MTKAGEAILFNHVHMEHTKTYISVGIDISAANFHLCLRDEEGKGVNTRFSNSVEGIEECLLFFKKHHFNGQIVMESTGRYHILSAIMMKEAGYQVSVVNPLKIKKYQKSHIRKTKTDKIDAQLLAEVAILEKDLPLFSLDRNQVMARKKSALLKNMERNLQSIKRSMKEYLEVKEQMGIEVSKYEQLCEEHIKETESLKRKLEHELISMVTQEDSQKAQCELLRSIPGVSPLMASLILSYYKQEEGGNCQQWVAYTGFDVSVAQSGNWHGHGRLVKRGNRFLRKRWFSCAWGAMMHSPHFKNYYDELKENGRSHTAALVIIARKLIRIAYQVSKTQQPYDPEKCFFLT